MRTVRKPKQHYNVFIIGEGDGVYAKNYCRQFIGETWASSAAQACNNVRYRMRDSKNPHGGYSTWGIGDILDEGSVLYTFHAELAEE